MTEHDPDPRVAGVDETVRSYDAVAERYAREFGHELAGKPVDRALYAMFAELVAAMDPTGPVGDVGCGPGHVSAHLTTLGLDVVGIDAAPGMIATARRAHPGLRFELGTFAELPARDGEWAGAVAPYSIIHLDRDGRRTAATELARVIRTGGWLLVAFHVSDAEHTAGTVRHVTEWWGHEVDLDFHFLDPAEVTGDLAAAGFRLVSRTDREPWPDAEHPSRRTYLLARRDAAS
ncbi:MAG TPA: class I SAM-dependent methyltransferase [Jiangellaceae bacterium]|nr:class I SAM-dependent methyltransferase [Jiangellaceae bacterium]